MSDTSSSGGKFLGWEKFGVAVPTAKIRRPENERQPFLPPSQKSVAKIRGGGVPRRIPGRRKSVLDPVGLGPFSPARFLTGHKRASPLFFLPYKAKTETYSLVYLGQKFTP